MNRRAWILFAIVAVLWGIPYLLIKIAIEELSPMMVVAGRVAVAAAVLVPVAALQGTLGALRRHWPPVVFLGIVHIVGPFLLITYGEVHISSSLTGLLIAIEPVLIALLMIRAEPLTRVRVAGLALGLVGVGVLVGLDVSGDRWGLLGAGMILLATLMYAVATVYVQRKAADLPPTALVAGTTTVSTVVLAPFAAFTLPTAPVSAGSWTALLALGLLCTAVALLAFYRLIGEAGPGRAGLVTYANPVVAVLLGVAILDEPIGLSTVLGFALIVAGCWLSTRPTAPAAPALARETRSPAQSSM
ncbi:DMT family transporter [Asanoa sp. WMMD1127]|uniref:DMT family transporter n=1 Tax=Asanoa sp. WMMD1127 TaxID=3016107 RepID=UPI002416603E|nr:DMT family transporter [Asanoa sp. WMMD1127]MDG4825688.1 DMT family transporter [Asanoa sp. WMMD1127]